MNIHPICTNLSINSRSNKNSVSFGNSKVNAIYYNDMHSQTKHIDSFLEFQDVYYKNHKKDTNVTLSGGDAFLDINPNNEIVAQKLISRTDAIAVGNHDIDAGNYLQGLIEKFNMNGKWLSANLVFNKQTKLKDSIVSSKVIEKNNERIGIIGVSPIELTNILFKNKRTDFIGAKSFDDTVFSIKEEVEKLEDKKINKIFLLAHTGEKGKDGTNYYREFAKIGGIDVILGGHDHREVNKWETSGRGEPVKIVSTGRSSKHDFDESLDYLGVLSLEFDDNGVLLKEKSRNSIRHLQEKSSNLSKKNVIYKLRSPLKEANPLIGHSEIGNMIADSNLWYVNTHTKGEKADFAFVNAGTIRGNFASKKVTAEDIRCVVPFTTSTLIKTDLTKKQIIATLNWCAESSTFTKITPGMMQVAGMKYDVNPDFTVSNVRILNDDGSVKYNLDDYPEDKKFVAVYDNFLMTGVAGLSELKKEDNNDGTIEHFGIPRQDALLEYLTKVPEIKDYKAERIKKL